jgi:putative NADH-flavin reductase
MRLAIFGGTGRVGRRLLEYAAREDHVLQALVRDPAKLPSGTTIHAVRGDATDLAAVRQTIEGADIVLSALGGAGLTDPGKAISGGMQAIVAAMTELGVKRVLAVAGAGVLDHPDGGLRGESPGFPEVFRRITAEHRATWEALRTSRLDWTLVCCPDIVEGAVTRDYRVSADLLPPGGERISVEDVADFMLRQAGRATFSRRRVGLAY